MRRAVGRWTVLGGTAVLAVAMYGSAGEAGAPQPRRPPVDFDKQIKPILGQLSRVSQRGQTQGRAVAGRVPRRARRRTQRRGRPARRGRQSLLMARVQGVHGDQMPLEAMPLTDAEIAPSGGGSIRARA